MTALEKLAAVLRSRTLPYVICHADLHARNLIRDPSGHVYVVDWDEVMLAPKERDFIFIRKPYAEAFFEGYGDAELDWSLLTYYLWERVVQDLIYNAHNVCFRDEWAEETRAQVAQTFRESLEPGGSNLRAAERQAPISPVFPRNFPRLPNSVLPLPTLARSPAFGFACSRPCGKPNVNGSGGTDSRVRQSWMRHPRQDRRGGSISGLTLTSMSRGANATCLWIRLASGSQSPSRLLISTRSEVPDACSASPAPLVPRLKKI